MNNVYLLFVDIWTLSIKYLWHCHSDRNVQVLEIGFSLFNFFFFFKTNVYEKAQKSKMEVFEGFKRKAVVIVPTHDSLRRRTSDSKRKGETIHEVPFGDLCDMKCKFSIFIYPFVYFIRIVDPYLSVLSFTHVVNACTILNNNFFHARFSNNNYFHAQFSNQNYHCLVLVICSAVGDAYLNFESWFFSTIRDNTFDLFFFQFNCCLSCLFHQLVHLSKTFWYSSSWISSYTILKRFQTTYVIIMQHFFFHGLTCDFFSQ